MDIIAESDITTILDIGRKLLDGVPFVKLYSEVLFEKYNVLLFYKDSKSIFLGCNKRLSCTSKICDPFSVAGKSDYDILYSKTQADGFRRDDQDVLFQRKPKLDIREPFQQFDKTESMLLTSKFPIHSSNREKVGVIGIATDVTEYDKLEKKLFYNSLK